MSGVEFSPEPVFLRCYSTDAQIHEYKGTNTNWLSMKCRQTNKVRDRSSSTAQISFQRIGRGEVMEVDKVISLDPGTKNVL